MQAILSKVVATPKVTPSREGINSRGMEVTLRQGINLVHKPRICRHSFEAFHRASNHFMPCPAGTSTTVSPTGADQPHSYQLLSKVVSRASWTEVLLLQANYVQQQHGGGGGGGAATGCLGACLAALW